MSYLTLAILIAFFGAILLVGEYFFATGGILLVAAVLCFFAAVGIIGAYGSVVELAVATIVGVVGVPLGTYGAILSWKRMFGGDPSPAAEASIAEMPELQQLTSFKGRVGKTTSALRPSGVVDFEGTRIDAISEGLMIEAGAWVKCVDVKPGKVIVREVEPGPTATPSIPSNPPPVSQSTPASDRKKPDLNADDWSIS